jgi:putative membrane protein
MDQGKEAAMKTKKNTLISLGISLALIAAGIWFLSYHMNSYGYGYGWWDMPGHMMFGGGGMGVVMILFWLAVIAAIALMVSGALSGRHASGHSARPAVSDALDILKRRYANGEIDQSQYEIMKQNLK